MHCKDPLRVGNVRSCPWWADFEIADLDDDGKQEIVASWHYPATTAFEKYVAVIGWEGSYKVLGTIPVVEHEELEKPDTPSIETTMELVFEEKGVSKQDVELRGCTHFELRNIDGDPRVEILCAHMIWRLNFIPGEGEGINESHFGPHNYFVQVLELYEGTIQRDYHWNRGEVLFVNEMLPTVGFEFTDRIIDMGKDESIR